jgi:hypothetical protein
MRAFAIAGEQLLLGLADVPPELAVAVEELGFARRGMVFSRSFAAPGADAAAARFESCAELMVRQAARLEPVPWEDALELLLERSDPGDWNLVGSAALAVRGRAVEPRDIDLTSDAAGAERLAAALADVLVEPIVDGGYLGARWFRAFAGARIECVGGPDASIVEADPSRLETVSWRAHTLRVPPPEVQLEIRRQRGLA